MQRSLALVALSLALVPLGACGATAARSPAPPPARPLPPASALAGAVHVLEGLAAARPADCVVEARALRAEVRHDSESRRPSAHVALDVSVFAPTAERAREVFEGLQRGLASPGAALALEPAAPERVLAALAELGTRAGPEALVSYTDRLELDLEPTPSPTPRSAPAQELAHDSLEGYVRSHASQVSSVGQVDVRFPGPRPTGPRAGLRLVLGPGQPFQRYRTAEIAAFLASLERDSPAVRVTGLTLERSAHEPDARNPRGWTYEAELTVAVREPADG